MKEKLKMILLFLILSVAGLSATGFLPAWLTGQPMHGYSLLLHFLSASLFLLILPVFLYLYAFRLFFRPPVDDFEWPERLCFLLTSIAAVPVIAASLIAMFPVMDTGFQQLLLNVHKISAVVFCIAFAGFLFFRLVQYRSQPIKD